MSRVLATATALVLPLGIMTATPAAAQAPVGQGFVVNVHDLDFILQQIRISEQHAAAFNASDPCAGLRGDGPDQIPLGNNGDVLPWGLRTVDGTCNNLVDGQADFGAADIVFPRLVPPPVFNAAEALPFDPDGPGPQAAGQPTSYAQTSGAVADSQPRLISNLVVDQTATNPAAVAAAGLADNPPAPTTPPTTLDVPNVAPDVGLSAPFNSWFTLFGQFFDHGLDLVGKGGSGTVFVPLRADDPLNPIVPPSQRFMVLTRATNQPGPDGVLGTADDVREHNNSTTPFVDQNQTYTSHPAHQAFLREYDSVTGQPVPTGRLIVGPGEGMGTWETVKTQAAGQLGILLADTDVLNVPLLATDPYGGLELSLNGRPQLVTAAGLVELDPAAPAALPANTIRTGHAFLDDIAHHAAPVDGRTGAPLTPDADTVVNTSAAAGQYDDEMLEAHFVAGDGRANENIGLTAVHHVFHSEHNRLQGDIAGILAADPTRLAAWQAVGPNGWSYGEKLFQAARFVTEMEYQHLVFEEFARKVQPLVNPFGEGGTGYNTFTNPAIRAEFAHAVYRFGHSMLTDTVARTNADGTSNDIGLIPAFLNPPEFLDGGTYANADEAAGAVVRGMTRQVGQEIDEFVIEALRNNLLGLPLDLATINMARARDTGTPTLNAARRAFFAETQNTLLAPYTSWVDFGFNLKHRDSLANFIAAYGTHGSITAVTSIADKRAAAAALLADPSDPARPVDADDFLNSTGPYANQANGATVTGVDTIDLWVGGLAEKRVVFGGLLGSTFNYVFELQMEELQFGDRFYYLSRVAGLNLLTQLEGNSFAELTQRNTDMEGLPADSFARPAYVFNVAALTVNPTGIADDPATTEYNEADRTVAPGSDLFRMPDGTVRYVGPEHVVFNGSNTAGDRVQSSEGDDTLRGNGGNDRLEGGDGVDNLIGGEGDDILTDLFGDDTIKGGPGNDAISSGQGFGGDLNQGGTGHDFVVGGNDATETFAGDGNDLVFAGVGDDTVFGDEGDDWIEGGGGAFNLLQGDSGNPFADDPNGGHDVLDGDGGEQDFDAEGGDDIMLMGPGIQRAEGMLGFDWTTHKGDPARADSDMRFTGLLPPTIDNLRDRFDLVEALSGADFNDILRGDDRGTADIAGGHELTADGIARIAGLADVLPAGATGFDAGNILLGGAGDDLIEGRGGDDVIDGDRWLDVRLIVAGEPAGTSYNSVTQLQQRVFAGTLNPGDISIVREIVTPATGGTDVVVFSGASTEYTITPNADGSLTVAHTGGTAVDGTDLVRNAEVLRFTNGDFSTAVNSPATGAPVLVIAAGLSTPQEGSPITLDTTSIADPNGLGAFSFQWQQRAAGSALPFANIAGATGPSFTPTQAEVNRNLQVVVTFTDGAGNAETLTSAISGVVGDVFAGDGAANTFNGTAGDDNASGNGGNDTLNGVAGNDTLNGGTGTDTLNGGSGNDTITVTGNDGSFDTIAGNADVDRILALAANTVIGVVSIATVEEINGGGFANVRVLGSGAAQTFNFGAVALVGIASVDGGGGNDTMNMSQGPDVALGGTGTDTINGNGGDDVIDGGAAGDVLNGGAGNDQFVFTGTTLAPFGADRITATFDANPTGGQDLIDLRGAGITAGNFGTRVTIAAFGTPAGSTRITVRDGLGLTVGTITVESVGPANFSIQDFVVSP